MNKEPNPFNTFNINLTLSLPLSLSLSPAPPSPPLSWQLWGDDAASFRPARWAEARTNPAVPGWAGYQPGPGLYPNEARPRPPLRVPARPARARALAIPARTQARTRARPRAPLPPLARMGGYRHDPGGRGCTDSE